MTLQTKVRDGDDPMGERGNLGDNADALDLLAAWLRRIISHSGLTRDELADQIHRDRTGVSQAVSGTTLPSGPLAEAIVLACGADPVTAGQLRENARKAALARRRRAAEGWPPAGLGNHRELCLALRDLVRNRQVSQRELVRRDNSGILRRSMVGYVLRGQRTLTRRVLAAIIDVCGMSPDAAQAWTQEWYRLALPVFESRRKARLEGLRARQGGRLYPRRWYGA